MFTLQSGDMNKTIIILIIAVIGLLACVGYLGKRVIYFREESDRMYINYTESLNDSSRVLNLTRQELKEYLKSNKRLDSLLKASDIKARKVKYITEIIHDYHIDTINIEVGQPDSDLTYPLRFDNGCISFRGILDPEMLKVSLINFDYNVTIDQVGKLDKRYTGRRRFWIFKIYQKFVNVKVENSCGKSKIHQLNITK